MLRRAEIVNPNHLYTKTVTGNYTVTDKDEVILVDATAGAVTITLPDSAAQKNLALYIKKVDSSGNAVTVATSNSQTIDGSSTATLSSQYATLAVVADGVNWQIKTVSASGTFTGGTITGATAVSVANANALTVGANGTTNPTLQVDTSTASVATGLLIKGAAAAGGLALSVISSGTNESLNIDAKGSGAITFNNTATGAISFKRGVTMSSGLTINNTSAPAAGGATMYKFTSTANFGIHCGSGAPTLSAAQGSIYLRTDGSSTSTRLYVNTDGGTTWTNLTSAA